MAPASGRSRSRPGTVLAADVTGTGPTVLLLHGQPGSAANWSAVIPALRSRFTVIAPDRLGYGRTGGRAAGFAVNAEATCELLDRLERRSAIVVGHSWGGGVALALAEAHPERVDGLVLVASVGPDERIGVVDRVLALRPVGAVVASVALRSAARALAHPTVRLMVDRRLPAAATSEALGAAWRDGGLARSFAIEQRALVDELPALGAGLAALGMPTAVLYGTADRIVPPVTGDHLAARMGDATVVRVDGGGHLLPYANPETVAAAVDDVARRAGLADGSVSPAPG
jgi:pimeloyl-ACP methyl ester carboxylesterase